MLLLYSAQAQCASERLVQQSAASESGYQEAGVSVATLHGLALVKTDLDGTSLTL